MSELRIEDKVIAFYVKLLNENKGPTAKMVLDPLIKEYEEYFKIKRNEKIVI